MIEPKHEQLSIACQCKLLGLPRSSYYREPIAGTDSIRSLSFMKLIDEEYMRHPFLGSRKLRDYLRGLGHKVNRKCVQRLMRKMGIESVAPKPNTSLKNKAHKVYPYLLRSMTINKANQVWCTDITYIRLQGGFVYLVAVMDWYSRKVLSWCYV
jgi:putative transposase